MQRGKFLRSWIFQVAFLAAAGFAVVSIYKRINKNQDKATSLRQYR